MPFLLLFYSVLPEYNLAKTIDKIILTFKVEPFFAAQKNKVLINTDKMNFSRIARSTLIVHCALLFIQLLTFVLLFLTVVDLGGRYQEVRNMTLIGGALFALIPLLGLVGVARRSRLLVFSFALLHLLVALPLLGFILVIVYHESGGTVQKFFSNFWGAPLLLDFFGAVFAQAAAMVYLVELVKATGRFEMGGSGGGENGDDNCKSKSPN